MKNYRLATLVVAGLAGASVLAACGSDSGSGSGSSASGSSTGAGGCTVASTDPGKSTPGGAIATGTGAKDLPSGQPGKGKPQVIFGSKNFPEQDVLGQIYTQALRSRGYNVELKPSLGSTEIAYKALTSGQINVYAEYTGVIYTVLAGRKDTPESAVVTYDVSKKYEESKGYTLLNPTTFQDADGVAVTPDYAKKNCLNTIADLKKVGNFTYAGPPENKDRFQGVLGLREAYGLTKLEFIPLTAGSQYAALDSGKTNSIAIFTTDGKLLTGKYAILKDTKNIFGYQQVAPLLSQKFLQQMGPEFEATLNYVSSLLTPKTILGINNAVQNERENAATTATKFLKANKVLS